MSTVISTNNAPAAIGPYSQAIQTSNMLFISGQVPINPKSGDVEVDTIEKQAEQVFKNLEAILGEAGYAIHHIVKTTCMLSDMDEFKSFNEVYAAFFGEHKPARATFQVAKLPLGVKVEVDAIAVKD